jgi:hypothetical protein
MPTDLGSFLITTGITILGALVGVVVSFRRYRKHRSQDVIRHSLNVHASPRVA